MSFNEARGRGKKMTGNNKCKRKQKLKKGTEQMGLRIAGRDWA